MMLRNGLSGRVTLAQTWLMSKVPCRECGAMILPATAESTGGICMACKQGIRENIESSRAYYAKQKIYDPFRALWESLVKRSSKDPALGDWSQPEKIYFAVSLLEGEIYNGGFDQSFHNSSADYYLHAINGLSEMGANESLTMTMEAANILFGKNGPPNSQEGRQKIMNSRSHQLSEILNRRKREASLDDLDKRFYEDPDNLVDRLTRYAADHGLVRPFEKTSD